MGYLYPSLLIGGSSTATVVGLYLLFTGRHRFIYIGPFQAIWPCIPVQDLSVLARPWEFSKECIDTRLRARRGI